MTLNLEGNSLAQQPAVRSTSSPLTAANHRDHWLAAGGSTGTGTGSSQGCTPLGGPIRLLQSVSRPIIR